MKQRAFQQVDVFTAVPHLGNGLAVVLDGSGLTTEAMQRFTDWTQLSEASFLLPPTHAAADYKVRIFCPGRELPFAGHPTLGSCHAWLAAGGQPKAELVVQECGVGLVRVRRDLAPSGGRLAFAAPPRQRSGPLDPAELARILAALQLQPSDVLASNWCDNGPPWRGLLLRDAAQVLALRPELPLLRGLDVGVVGAHRPGSECAFEVRAFFTGAGGVVVEDPVTGSLNAALAQWLVAEGLAPPRYTAAQGTALRRAGRVHVHQQGDDIWIGGHSVTCIQGQVLL
jgi:PhzF family phenazine biosynthesis protein